ncbi:MAG: hypothetical protein HN921_09840 [Bacteroidetes bacterium]|jgi:hypothetical protein|nr:hypothetical protein [Bacteroidota bacterium]
MKEISKLPYTNRRVIVIAPKDKKEQNKSNVAWGKAISLGGAVAAGSELPFQYKLIGTAIGTLMEFYMESNRNEQEKLSQEDNSTKENYAEIIVLTSSEAISQLEFPPGHPIIDHAYVGHPLVPTKYIPSAVFHSTLFEEKVNELVTLLASLGATRVRVVCHKGYRTLSRADTGTQSPIKGVGIDASISSERNSKQSAVFEEHFRPTGDICIPNDKLWFEHEHSWQSIAKRRMNYGTTKFQVSLKYEDDYGINANMQVGLENFGFKLGGQFSNFESTVWEFDGEFE